MGFGGCFSNRNLIEGDFFQEFIRPILDCPDRLSRALRFLARMNFDRMDEFHRLHRFLTMPVAFVWGSSDETFPEKLARKMAKQFPNVIQFTSVPQGKVFMHEEYPELVAKPLLESLLKT
jgi:pimeloyl-ACP methyl ester carboxylesterase